MIMEEKHLSTAQAIKRTRAELVERFPLAFAGKGEQKRPLKIGIREDIKAAWPEVSDDDLGRALMDYTGGFKYLRNVAAGQARLDLDGQPCGIVTEGEAIHAGVKVGKIHRLAAKRRKRVIEADRLAAIQDAAE